MTPRKGFPPAAEGARTEAIAQAKKILLQMVPMKDALDDGKTVSSLELSIRMNRMSDAANRIIQELAAFSKHKFRE